ncbi:hypothetical protein [Chamaesiphon sp. GL140_3_metabinner_50]|uniref:hypothetical protein n=1 Tax=Chamaesiphon sp. GL140_3_metabinner_50 TaxID=2970812 RepID=UPI0025ED167B|nr:hypothetical protein [Chamaesiphon sp. GL140_3_metabinner_50]
MALIEISNLKPAGSELFASEESFLTELQATDSSQIFGGGGNGCGGGSNKGSKKGSKKNSKGGGYGCPPPPCYPCYPSH